MKIRIIEKSKFIFIPFFLFLSVLSFLPSARVITTLPSYDEKRLWQVFSLFVIGLTLLLVRALRERISIILMAAPFSYRLAFVLVFTLGLFLALNSPYGRYALLELFLFSMLLVAALYITVCYLAAPKFFTNAIIWFFVISVTLHFLSFLQNWILILLSISPPNFDYLRYLFGNPRFMNQWQGIILPIFLVAPLILSISKKRWSFIHLLLASFFWVSIFISGGRGVVLALIVGAVLSGVLVEKSAARFWWALHFKALVGGFLLYQFVRASIFFATESSGVDGLGRILGDTSSSGRVEIWLQAWHQFLQHPWQGIGGMHFQLNFPGGMGVSHPHNIVLQLLVEWGLPFSVAVLSIAGFAFLRWASALKHTRDKQVLFLKVAITNGILTGCVHSLFSGVWVMPLSQMAMVLLIGWAVGIYIQEHSLNVGIERTSLGKFPSHIASVVLLLSLGGIGYGVFPEILRLNEWRMESYRTTGSRNFAPRFWMQGRIRPYINNEQK
ncbi:O-antigen ligase family protein [Spongiibacter sp. KMU-158]|uniref:O-antigen ligase family protein n=1 Tax=Spongiibacter pelagi TaxID=2760804 RepID=A0A927GX92_9GAMM|nr:O-antigen ligase family protein [Spongiibacter pelagi]MBD2859757.1 O-antigen ligase family protein [Spongiibacter pelagi]